MRFLLVFVCLLLINIPVFSQFAIGLQGGGNFSTVEIFRRPEFLTRNVKIHRGAQYGVTFRYLSEKHAGLQMEINYSQRGWRDVNDTSDVRYTRTFDYIEVPVKTHFSIGNGKVRIILEGGPYIAYMFNSSQSTEDLNVENSRVESEYVFDSSDNRWDYGIRADGGLQLYFPFGAFEVKAFYAFGYANMFMDKSQAVERSQNRIYGLNFGYLYYFGGGKKSKPTEDQQ